MLPTISAWDSFASQETSFNMVDLELLASSSIWRTGRLGSKTAMHHQESSLMMHFACSCLGLNSFIDVNSIIADQRSLMTAGL